MSKRAKEIFRQHAEKMAELKRTTNVDANTMQEVIDEGTLHLAEHFQPAIGPQYKRDYVLIMGKAFLGTAKNDPTHDVNAATFFRVGDMHEWSHDLADCMVDDPVLAKYVLHAIQIYSIKKITGK